MQRAPAVLLFVSLAVALSTSAAAAQEARAVEAARADAAIKSAFPSAPADWQSRLVPDETMRTCSAYRNHHRG